MPPDTLEKMLEEVRGELGSSYSAKASNRLESGTKEAYKGAL